MDGHFLPFCRGADVAAGSATGTPPLDHAPAIPWLRQAAALGRGEGSGQRGPAAGPGPMKDGRP